MLSILGSQLAFRWAGPLPARTRVGQLRAARALAGPPVREHPPLPPPRPAPPRSAATTLAKKTFEFSITTSLKGAA